MRKTLILFSFVLATTFANSQRFHIGVFGGLAAYNGDLTEKIFPKKVTNGAIGITGNYELTDKIMLRGGFTYAIVGGADRFSDKPELVLRNLAFETRIFEFSAIGEYYFFNLYDRRYSPYLFAGMAVFSYDPYAFNGTDEKVFLQPLGTEGQGISGYPDKPYGLTQFAIPFGGGLKFAITENLRVGVELGMRKLFTDYLDDVSKNYPDEADLLAARGQLAVDMSYRGDEVGGSPTFPTKDAMRGSPKSKDYYYFTGIHLTYKFGSGDGGNGYGGGGGRGKKKGMGCPTNVY
jgi:hypothetical protein